MVKMRFTGANKASIMAKRKNKNYAKDCSNQKTFTEACFIGEVPEEELSRPDVKPAIKLEIVGDKEPSQYSPSSGTAVDGKPVTLKLDLGGSVWIVGNVEEK